MDLSGLLNPKRVLAKRDNESDKQFQKRLKESTILDDDGVVVSAPKKDDVKFGKKWTAAEREEQMRKLAEKLRKREE